MTLETMIIIICAVMTLGCYIYLKATGIWWYGIQWGRIFYEFRRSVCRLLIKFHN